MAWLCLRNDDYQNSQMCIVTGPNIDIAIKLIKRMKGLFEARLGIIFDSKETLKQLSDSDARNLIDTIGSANTQADKSGHQTYSMSTDMHKS